MPMSVGHSDYACQAIMSGCPTRAEKMAGTVAPMAKQQTLGSRVRLLRKRRGMSQAVVAEAVGIGRSTYTGIETGEDTPGRETLIAIADLFGGSLDWIEGRLHKVDMPELGQFVNDPDKLTLLAFWDALDDDRRGVFLDMLRPSRAAG